MQPSLRPEAGTLSRLSVCLLTRDEERNIERAVRSVAGLAEEVLAANSHQIGRVLDDSPGDLFQQVADVVAEVDALQRLANEPCRRVVENRHALRTGVPRAVLEFVDLVTGLAAEQARQANVAVRQYMYGQVIGSRCHR